MMRSVPACSKHNRNLSTALACLAAQLVKAGVRYPILWGGVFMGVFMGVNESVKCSVG